MFASIKDIEKINQEIEELKLSINKKEDDLKNLLNEKDIIIKELKAKINVHESIIKNNEKEIKKLNTQIQELINKYNNEFKENDKKMNSLKSDVKNIIKEEILSQRKIDKYNYLKKFFLFSERISKEFDDLESLEKNYGFLSSIGIKLLVPKEKNKIEGFIKAPDNSPYKNGIFNFELIYSNDYPKKGPELRFKTRIFHNECNWNNGHICIRMLNEWDSRYLLSQILSTLYEFLAVGYYSKMAIIMKQIIG